MTLMHKRVLLSLTSQRPHFMGVDDLGGGRVQKKTGDSKWGCKKIKNKKYKTKMPEN